MADGRLDAGGRLRRLRGLRPPRRDLLAVPISRARLDRRREGRSLRGGGHRVRGPAPSSLPRLARRPQRLVLGRAHARLCPVLRQGATLVPVSALPPVELHVISDSTGETAARLVSALEAQFPDLDFEEVRHPRVETVDDLRLAVNRMRGRRAVAVYTLVQEELRQTMRALCRKAKVHYCDLLGHPIDAVRRVSGQAAAMTPGTRAPLNSAYFKRMEAIEFAVKFDDGVGRGLEAADIVLVGVSRTSKTPLSIYLGYLGHKAANVPIVKGIEPPEELFRIDSAKVVGLTIDASRLAEIRQARVRNLGASPRAYAELVGIYEELDQAAAIHRRLGCPVLEVSDLSIEETAQRVIRIVQQRKAEAKAS
ncbi:MAG: kinase/pyrophosphorylase [Actinobacteria bacterium]|nr:MAG: kinase/pyrophosphorylase [Actinomycetota bacterium]